MWVFYAAKGKMLGLEYRNPHFRYQALIRKMRTMPRARQMSCSPPPTRSLNTDHDDEFVLDALRVLDGPRILLELNVLDFWLVYLCHHPLDTRYL